MRADRPPTEGFCDPGSPSDCLAAEIYDDGSALFVAPNPARRCTAYSIAAHSLYEESHPQLQFYPEACLRWRRRSSPRAIRVSPASATASSYMQASPGRGASSWRDRGGSAPARSRDLIDAADLAKIPSDVLVYGRNGVQAKLVPDGQRELGIIVETAAKTQEAAVLLASLLTHYLIHYGFPGRKATVGNVAYPLSPNLLSFRRDDGLFGAIVPSGTRDPVFFEHYPKIKEAVIDLIHHEFPDALANASYTITDAEARIRRS